MSLEAVVSGLSARECLTLTLGQEMYAIDIHKVKEIRGYERPTTIANTPDFIKGVINLRGAIVPIVDLRMRFHVSPVDYGPSTVVIILNIGSRVVGIVADSVSDVVMLSRDDIKPAPGFSGAVDTKYLSGIAAMGEQMLLLLDIEHLVNSSELALADDPA